MKLMKSTAVIVVTIVILIAIQSMIGTDSETLLNTDTIVFPHDEVVEVSITIDELDLVDLNTNAMNETTYMADITYNGIKLESVGIRAKGNSSLSSVAKTDSERYSFKIDFDEYIDEQSLLGLEKINLNNLFSDPSMMAEYLSYEALESIEADVPRTTYVNLTINDESHGLYLAVEQVDETFLINHYGNTDGELYKPEMGNGSDLTVSDNYNGIIDKLGVTDNLDHFESLVMAIKNGDVSEMMNTESFLKYLAVSTMVIHYDSYQGGMYHNYYLYWNKDAFEWITWDLNMAFNGFPKSGLTDAEAVQGLIDEPVIGDMSQYPLVEAVLSDETNIVIYHDYLSSLRNNYFNEEVFEARVIEVYSMIKNYVSIDPTSFYSYEEFENALFSEEGIIDFAEARVSNVTLQLNGNLESSNDGKGNTGSTGMKALGVEDNDRMQPDLVNLIEIVGRDNLDEDMVVAIESGEVLPIETVKFIMDGLTEDQRGQLIGEQSNQLTNENRPHGGQKGGEIPSQIRTESQIGGGQIVEKDLRDSPLITMMLSVVLFICSLALIKIRK